MIVKNEEKVLARCLKSVEGLVDEKIIVDTGSTDRTIEIAESFGAIVYQFEWENDFAKARNFALSKATHPHRLILDADEYIISWDREELNKLGVHQIGVVTLFDQYQKEGEIKQAKSYLSRMIPENTYYVGAVHEQIESPLSRVRIPIEIGHDGYLHVDKSERNLSILYTLLEEAPNDSYTLYQIAHTLFVAKRYKEADKYYRQYYKMSQLNEVYRCGAIVDYLYNMIELGDLNEGLVLIEAEKTRYSDSPDFYFVCGHFYRELILSDINKYINYLPYIERSFLRCLEIGETDKYDSVVGTGSYEAAYNLGAWYEVIGQMEQARRYYEMAMKAGYIRAKERLSAL